MDSRLLMDQLLQADAGNFFMVRNAGNLVPHAKLFGFNSATTEPGAVELGCVMNNIKHVAVCGHSDCKAMAALWDMRDETGKQDGTPLQLWIRRHGAMTITKYEQLEAAGGVGPIMFKTESPNKTFKAYIDPDKKLSETDRLSQVNTLQQIEHIASHQILKDKLSKDEVKLHALWYDISSADFFMFSRSKERFLLVDENNYDQLKSDGTCPGEK